MSITRIDITASPGPVMSRCVMFGHWVYLAGVTAPDASEDVKGQTRQSLTLSDQYLA
ncbi:MAG: hypothetical protein Q6L68_07890 [Thermostichus sp. DG02_5_bins_236]